MIHTPDTVARFETKYTKGPGCWLWQAHITKGGYGGFRVGARNVNAHRVAYEIYQGPIPVGLHIDHLCRNRACVNPAHLEPVTQAINTLRGQSFAAANAIKTVCKYGHDNWGKQPKGRSCKTCAVRRTQAWQLKKGLRSRLPSIELPAASKPHE